jgi:LAS superfamily LD-carboxypeptidase LdcB
VWPIAYLALVLVALIPSTAFALPAAPKDPLASLRKQAEQAVSSLQKATRTYEKHRSDLRQAKKKLRSTTADLRTASKRLARLRVPLARYVNAQYQNPGNGIADIALAGTPADDMHTAADAYELTIQRSTLVSQAATLHDSKKTLANSAKRLVTGIEADQKRLGKEIISLRKKANRTVHTLLRKAARMGVAADRSGRLTMFSCDAASAAEAEKYPNGLIPKRYLCDLPQKGYQLRADAAVAFARLNSAYQQHFGHQACVTSAYRDISKQRMLYQSKPPGYAAVPGTSNHGLGLAVDFCGGVENQGSAPFIWLRANSKRFGWVHPAWAYTGPFEPWHWEFVPKGGKPSSGGDQNDRSGR